MWLNTSVLNHLSFSLHHSAIATSLTWVRRKRKPGAIREFAIRGSNASADNAISLKKKSLHVGHKDYTIHNSKLAYFRYAHKNWLDIFMILQNDVNCYILFDFFHKITGTIKNILIKLGNTYFWKKKWIFFFWEIIIPNHKILRKQFTKLSIFISPNRTNLLYEKNTFKKAFKINNFM